MAFVTRFAPSPTGYLHRGHAFSALTAYTAARAAAGRFLLRMEDIDLTRCRPEYEAAILEDLAWLELQWETPVRRQSDHLDDYRGVLERLDRMGLLYRCFRTRREILEDIGRAPHGPADPAAQSGPEDPARPYAWRLSLERAREHLGEQAWAALSFVDEGRGLVQARPETAGDVVLGRKDTGVAYHLAVVWDDALEGVTHVIRGEDLFEATHIQRLLQALLDLPTPTYHHHDLLTAPDGKRYAKRDQSETLRALRETGMTANELRESIGFEAAS